MHHGGARYGTWRANNPVADPPAIGTCLALAGSDIDKLTIFVHRVSCDNPAYTAQVFATPDMSYLGDDPLSTFDRSDVEEVIGSACNESQRDRFLGADEVETPFVQSTYFTPTAAAYRTCTGIEPASGTELTLSQGLIAVPSQLLWAV